MKLLKRLFLVKEIKSREGVLHFQRYRLLWTPFFSIYLHYIARSDEDTDPHNHPWEFSNLILSGEYIEDVYIPDKNGNKQFYCSCIYKPYTSSIQYHGPGYTYNIYHKIRLIKPTWSLFFTGRRKKEKWGYLTDNGFVPFDEYREKKNSGELAQR